MMKYISSLIIYRNALMLQ